MKIQEEKSSSDIGAHTVKFPSGPHRFHWHEKFEICQLMDNSCEFLIDSKIIQGKKGDIIAINEHTVHLFTFPETGATLRIIQFLPKYVMDLRKDMQLKTHITAEEIENIPHLAEKFDSLFCWMEEEDRNGHINDNPFMESCARTMYLLLMRHFKTNITGIDKNLKEFYKIAEYVNLHFTENINVKTLADKLYIPRGRLSSLFTKYSRMGLNEYIDTLRIENVNNLLSNGYTVTDAAYESGFQSIRTFNSVYKRIMGISPSEYISKNTSDVNLLP